LRQWLKNILFCEIMRKARGEKLLNRRLRILVDTNVAYTFLSEREDPFFTETFEIMRLCALGNIDGYLALHSLSSIWYISRKLDDKERRKMLLRLCNILTVVGASHNEVVDAVKDANFKDFEDCLQNKCAKESVCDYIVTVNLKDFVNSEVTAIAPDELLKIIYGK